MKFPYLVLIFFLNFFDARAQVPKSGVKKVDAALKDQNTAKAAYSPDSGIILGPHETKEDYFKKLEKKNEKEKRKMLETVVDGRIIFNQNQIQSNSYITEQELERRAKKRFRSLYENKYHAQYKDQKWKSFQAKHWESYRDRYKEAYRKQMKETKN